MSGLGLQLKQSRALRLTSNLRQAIGFLGMSNRQFGAFLEFRAQTNPYLDLQPQRPADPVGAGPDRAGAPGGRAERGPGVDIDRIAGPDAGLSTHVQAQVRLVLRDPAELRIADHFIEALEPTGWLGQRVAEVASAADCTPEQAEAVLRKIQQIEPAGLFARSLAECLRLQAVDAGCLDPVMDCVLANLGLIAKGRLAEVATLAGSTAEEVAERLRRIRSFDPKPGARFSELAERGIRPDVSVAKGADGWVVDLRGSLADTVVVRPVPNDGTGGPLSAAERDLLAEARAIRQAAERRESTLLAVVAEIVRRQSAFLAEGPRALAPLRLVDVAEALGLHESTVSRVTSGRFVATPRGTLCLRDFFSASLADEAGGGEVAAGAVRAEVGRLIAGENKASPLSDEMIARLLGKRGMRVARRTVAKYREQLGLPSSAVRKRRPAARASGVQG